MTRMIALETYRGTGRPTGHSRVIESRDEARDGEIVFPMREGESESDAHARIFDTETVTDAGRFIQWRGAEYEPTGSIMDDELRTAMIDDAINHAL